MKWIFLLCLPLAAFAQYEFDPVRLDDGVDSAYHSTQLGLDSQGNIMCIWSSESPERQRASGRIMSVGGEFLGGINVYAESAPDSTFSRCFLYVNVQPLASGGEVRQYGHA